MEQMHSTTDATADSDGRLNRIRSLLAEAERTERPGDDVLDDIAGIVGPRDPPDVYQKPLG